MALYPSIYDAKEIMLDIGRRMYDKGFAAANDGNISCKLDDNIILTTPTGVSKGYMKAETLVKMTLDGEILAMGDLQPSSEIKMHIRAYRENPNILAVVHAHPPVAASFAIAGIGLDKAIMPEAIVNLGTIPIAKYANPGTTEVPDSIAPFCKDYNAVLLANHGALTWGKDLMEAYFRMESVEYYATVMMYTGNILEKSNILSCDQVNELLKTRERMGVTTGGVPPCALKATNTCDVLPGASQAKCGCIFNKENANQELGNKSEEDVSELIAKITQEVMRELNK